jgi:hypothetical protein
VADSDALRAKRHRRHRDGDHALCKHGPVLALVKDEPGRLARAVAAEFPETDPMSRALALQLADLGSGRGAAAVQALRALGELVAWQRDGR